MYERSFSSLLGCALHEVAINRESSPARTIANEEDSVNFIWQGDEVSLWCLMCVAWLTLQIRSGYARIALANNSCSRLTVNRGHQTSQRHGAIATQHSGNAREQPWSMLNADAANIRFFQPSITESKSIDFRGDLQHLPVGTAHQSASLDRPGPHCGSPPAPPDRRTLWQSG